MAFCAMCLEPVPNQTNTPELDEVRSLRFPNEPDSDFIARVEQTAQVARLLIDACLANDCVQQLIADSRFPIYTQAGFEESPIVQVDFEEAYAIGSIEDGLAATARKRWGEGPWILPLRADEYVDPYFVTYCYKPNSKRRIRFEQRQRMKELLGRTHRSLVKFAQRNTKRTFLDELDSASQAAIASRLKLDPGTFWRAAKGTKIVALPLKPKQLTLFD